jgi:uncharacterized protein (TIGR03086 family)
MRINGSEDLVGLDRRAVERSIVVVGSLTAADLGRATPCAEWTLGDLLGHMIVQHDGFAAAADGSPADLSTWVADPVGRDPAAEYSAAAARVIGAFARHDPDRGFWLPEIRDGGPFPAAMAIGFHLVDYVVHNWDVAVSMGAGVVLDDAVVAAALRIAERVPAGAAREVEGAAFKPVLPIPAGSSEMAQLLLVLGRDPSWVAP